MIRLPYLEVLRKFLILFAIIKGTQAQSSCSVCPFKNGTVHVATTSISIPSFNCNVTENATLGIQSGLEPGKTYNVICSSQGVTCCAILTTQPAVIRNLTVSDITTSSVFLRWTKPEGTSSFYIVEWTDGSTTMNETTLLIDFNVVNLTAGVNYTFRVMAVAGDNVTTGLDTSVSQYTRPQQPSNITVWDRSNSSLIVKWILPTGVVDFYNTILSNDELNVTYNYIVKTETANFSQLQPGRLYMFTVTAVAGAFSNQSDGTQIATPPNPPGAVLIPSKDNASLNVQWALPVLMEKAPNVSYYITYQCPGCKPQKATSLSNGTILSGLASGTFYNITVITVGPQGYFSTGVQNSSFTLPNPVLSLRARPESTNSVRLMWAPPFNVQTYYTYRVQASYNQSIIPAPANISEAVVTNLEPGTVYNFIVITVAAPGSEATSEGVVSYTKPKAVTNLTLQDPKTNPVRLTWSRQDDFKANYSYLVIVKGDSVYLNISFDGESCNVSNLIPGGFYTFAVFTVVGGVRSDQVNISSYLVPERPSGIVVIGTTTDLTVTWSAPRGKVEMYTVQLLNSTGLESTVTINASQSLLVLFQNLSSGQLYNVTVIAQSGSLTQESVQVQNATLPNPPGSIIIGERTTSSINISWAEPVNMLAGNYSFFVQLSPGQNTNTSNNWILLGNLKSGTFYSITLNTVGVLGYQSTVVTAASFTRPTSVSMLTVIGITPISVNLTWVQTDKQAFSYQVNVTNPNGSLWHSFFVNTTTTPITGLQSGSNYTFTVTTMTRDGTMATPVTVFYFTRPYAISGLIATTLNTTAVKLTWTQPFQNQSSYTYRIMTTVCVSAPRNNTVKSEEDVVSNLTPGTNCTFSVSVVAPNGIEGDAILTYQYTKPEVAQLNCSNSISNHSVLVRWAVSSGNVEQYLVVLTSHLGPSNDTLNSSQTSKNFDNLSAATIYNATVTTVSGPFNATSLLCTTATFPNPPGPMKILTKTTNSFSLQWDEALLMIKSSFTYYLTYASFITTIDHITTTNFTTTLSNLSSGTPYNISLVTVGPLSLTSAEVRLNLVTTRPESVRNLLAEDTVEGSVTLTWLQPIGVQPGYQYQVNKTNSSSVTTYNTTVILVLDPGSRYNFTVTSMTADGTTGAPAIVPFCTKASPVSSLRCAGPNGPDAKLILYWSPPKGGSTGFNVTTFQGNNLGPNSVTGNVQCNPTCMVNVTGLSHYTTYSVNVQTLSCGLASTVINCSNITGITSPPIPSTYLSLASVSGKDYNMFTVRVDPKLLNNSQGPIQQIGVLVTSDPSKMSKSDLKQYLNKTYDNWSNGDPAYLATVQNISMNVKSGGNSDLTIVIGNGNSFSVYVNHALKPMSTYSYAIVIFTQMKLTDGLVNVPSSFVSVTQWYSSITLSQDPAVIGTVVGVSIGCFLVLLVILISLVVYMKRRQAKKTTDIPIHSMRSKVSVPVRVEEYEAYYKKQKADSNCGFAAEFEDLKPVGTSQVKNSALAMENKSKNRYNNVLPYDSSRVKLSTHGSPFDDYINANYIPGHNSRKEFIAAQGPLPVTVNEFWRMIWEKNVQTLVMLTRCNEQGRVKCEEYWPSEIRTFGNITVTTTSEIPLEDWTIRDFNVKNVKTAETRAVRHFHFTAWPDHGVPETTELLINFRHLVREHMDQYSCHSPTIVHCSAGVGRTGTFIAIDRLIFQIERESTVDVYGTIHDLRMHRPLMVQTEDQYVFLNQCAMDIIRSRTGTNVDLIYQNTAALSIYENVEPKKRAPKNGFHNA